MSLKINGKTRGAEVEAANWTFTFKVTPLQQGSTGQETAATPPIPHPESGERPGNTESGCCIPMVYPARPQEDGLSHPSAF